MPNYSCISILILTVVAYESIGGHAERGEASCVPPLFRTLYQLSIMTTGWVRLNKVDVKFKLRGWLLAKPYGNQKFKDSFQNSNRFSGWWALSLAIHLPLSLPMHHLSPRLTLAFPTHLLKMLLLLPLASRAQGYAEGASLSYEGLHLHLKTLDNPAFRADIYRASTIVSVAQAADSSHSFLAGASLELLRFAGDRPGFGVSTVYGLSSIVGYRQRLNEQLELTALALPALNSDLHEVRRADITWGGVVRAVYRRNPRRAYRLTMGYRQQFYGPQYVLLLGLDWRLGARWRAFGDLPTSFTLSYAVVSHTNIGFNLTGINTAYRLHAADQYVQYQQGHYGLFAENCLSAHWVLRATVAYALTRRIEVYARDQQWPATLDYIGLGTPPIPASSGVEKGLAFKLALGYRVSTR